MTMMKWVFTFFIFYGSWLCAQTCEGLFVKSQAPLFNQTFGSLFEPIQLKLEGDFSKALELKRAEDPYGDSDPNELFVAGTLYDPKYLQRKFKVKIKARGNSILEATESDFPKLKIEIEKREDLGSTLFSAIRKFRINTHVKTHPTSSRTPRGRVGSELAPWREGLAYRIAKELGLIVPQTSLAQINYVNKNEAGAENFLRKALLIETDSALLKRLNSRLVDEFTEIDGSPKPILESEDAALFFLYHKMIGNNDVALRIHEPSGIYSEKYRIQWNTFVIETPELKKLPVVYDLDLATMVTGTRYPSAFLKLNSIFKLDDADFASFFTQLVAVRQKIDLKALISAAQVIKNKKENIIKLIQLSPVDEIGKAIALKHVKMFVENIDVALNLPVIAEANIKFYKYAEGERQKTALDVNGDPFPLRPGTPVQILKTEGDRLRVGIMDIHGDLRSSESVVGYIDKNTIISQDLPLELLGLLDERDM